MQSSGNIAIHYVLEISTEEDCLHVSVRGEEGYENALAIWREIVLACELSQCRKILAHGILTGPSPTLDLYSFGRSFDELGLPPGLRIAIVCNKEEYQKLVFIEDIVSNRFPYTVKIFTEEESARIWLSLT